jgi:hypothetical protein
VYCKPFKHLWQPWWWPCRQHALQSDRTILHCHNGAWCSCSTLQVQTVVENCFDILSEATQCQDQHTPTGADSVQQRQWQKAHACAAMPIQILLLVNN